MDRSNLIRIAEEMVEDRRGDVVRKIPVNAETTSTGELQEIELQDVARDDFDRRPFDGIRLDALAQILGKANIRFDGDDAPAPAGEQARHFAVASADFEPDVVRIARQRFENSLLPRWIAKEVLPQFLTRHGERV